MAEAPLVWSEWPLWLSELKSQAEARGTVEHRVAATGCLASGDFDRLGRQQANAIDRASSCKRAVDPRDGAGGRVSVRRWHLGRTPGPRVDRAEARQPRRGPIGVATQASRLGVDEAGCYLGEDEFGNPSILPGADTEVEVSAQWTRDRAAEKRSNRLTA